MRSDMNVPKELHLFNFSSVSDLEQWVMGSDADVGGLSKAQWGLTPQKTGLFWGTLSTRIPENSKLNSSGYAGIRSREKPLTLFHRPRLDTSLHRYLAIRAKGDTKQWFVNIQTDSLYPSFLWQHRLHFETPGEWETILVCHVSTNPFKVPFRDFVLTSNGFLQKRQMEMDRTKVKTIGFSAVRQDGDFSLEIESIKAINTQGTIGDYDLLKSDEYLDEFGDVQKYEPGAIPKSNPWSNIKLF